MRFKIETVTLSDPRVAAHLDAATDESDRFRSKIRLDKSWAASKTLLRAHRSESGRFYVRGGLRGSSRLLLANKVKVTSFEGSDHPLFEFTLDVVEQSRQADRAAFEARYPECA